MEEEEGGEKVRGRRENWEEGVGNGWEGRGSRPEGDGRKDGGRNEARGKEEGREKDVVG